MSEETTSGTTDINTSDATDGVVGYALKQNVFGWEYRVVDVDMPLEADETYYDTKDAFPQEAKDWFAAHAV